MRVTKQIFEFLIFHKYFCVYDRFLSFEARDSFTEMIKITFLLGGVWKLFYVQSVLSDPYPHGDRKINQSNSSRKDISGVKWIHSFRQRSKDLFFLKYKIAEN